MLIQHPVSLQEKIDELHSRLASIASDTRQLLMDRHKTIIYCCSVCDRGIFDGNACIDISRLVEHHETCDGGREVTVIDADALGTLCARCGAAFASAADLRQKLRRILLLEELPASTSEETCDRCHDTLGETGARVTVQMMISQVEHTPGVSDDATHFPIFAETVLSFCPSCANHMSRSRLGEAMDALLESEGDDG